MNTETPKLLAIAILVAIITGSFAVYFDAMLHRIDKNTEEIQELRAELASHDGKFAHAGILERTNLMLDLTNNHADIIETIRAQILSLFSKQ